MQNQQELKKALLNPQSVALVGASSNPEKNTARPLRFMLKHQYQGSVFPINAGQPETLGIKAYPDLSTLPQRVDHVFIMIPGAHVINALKQCAQAGARLVTIYSDGFAEAGAAGSHHQEQLLQEARSLGLRVLGPNSIGVANLHNGSILSVNAAFDTDNLQIGDIALVSQSGSMMGSLYSRAAARGFGFSHLISVGNECDVSVGEIVDALVDDPYTRKILLFLETIRDPQVLADALCRAQLAGKPVLVYKIGRSRQSETLSQSHTGAMAGNDAATNAFLKAHGAMRVEYLETLFEMAPLAAHYMSTVRPAPGMPRRVAVLTTTGGGAAIVVDRLGLHDIEAVAPPPAFVEQMSRQGIRIKQSPIIDLTLAGTSKDYQTLLQALLDSDWCDAVLSVVGSSAQFHPSLAIAPIVQTNKSGTHPLFVFLTPEAPESLALLNQHGIAAFRTPEACADAMHAFFTAQDPKMAAAKAAARRAESVVLRWPSGLPRSGPLTEYQALRLWDDLGIERAQSELISIDQPQHSVPYPVALKVVSPDIQHKTERGGVCLNICNDAELAQALFGMHTRLRQHAPQARIDGYLVQHMEDRLIELILGFREDPLVGPIVMLGAGGITAELQTDTSIRLAPVSRDEAMQMIHEVRHTELIRGFRNLPRGNCEALADTIVALSQLANMQDDTVVTDAEINPLFVQSDRVVAVDGLICTREQDVSAADQFALQSL